MNDLKSIVNVMEEIRKAIAMDGNRLETHLLEREYHKMEDLLEGQYWGKKSDPLDLTTVSV